MNERLLMSIFILLKKIAKVDPDPDPEPKAILECKKRFDWSNWKEAIKSELILLN